MKEAYSKPVVDVKAQDVLTVSGPEITDGEDD